MSWYILGQVHCHCRSSHTFLCWGTEDFSTQTSMVTLMTCWSTGQARFPPAKPQNHLPPESHRQCITEHRPRAGHRSCLLILGAGWINRCWIKFKFLWMFFHPHQYKETLRESSWFRTWSFSSSTLGFAITTKFFVGCTQINLWPKRVIRACNSAL